MRHRSSEEIAVTAFVVATCFSILTLVAGVVALGRLAGWW